MHTCIFFLKDPHLIHCHEYPLSVATDYCMCLMAEKYEWMNLLVVMCNIYKFEFGYQIKSYLQKLQIQIQSEPLYVIIAMIW